MSGEDVAWRLPTPKAGCKMEKCLMDKKDLMIPEAMIEQGHIFKEVVNIDTWKNHLTADQKTHLMKLLPKFPENDKEEKEETLERLFNGDNFKFGNPLTQFHSKLRDGFYSPDIAKYSSLCRTVKFREYKRRQQTHYSNLLKEILLSRERVFEQLKKMPSDGRLKLEYKAKEQPQQREKTIEHKVRKKYVRLMKEVREECGVEDTSSEEEECASPAQRGKKQLFKSLCPIPSPEPTVPSVIATFSSKPTLNGNVTGEIVPISKRQRPFSPVEVSEEDYHLMLRNHKKKKLEDEDYPELNTQNISLQDIMARCQANKKSPKPSPENNASSVSLVKKKKIKLKEKTEKKLKKAIKIKQETIKSEANHSGRVPLPYHDESANNLGITDFSLKVEDDTVPDFPLPETCPPKLTFGHHNNFFSLVRDLLNEFPDGKFTTAKLEEKVREWQEAPTSSLNTWYPLQTNWVDTVISCLKFLAGDMIGATPENFVPYVDYKERAQQWRWIGVGRDSDESLDQLFKHWMANKKESAGDLNESGQCSPPPPRSRTSFVVRVTTDDEKSTFREQEKRRFEDPHKAFTYKMHGYESVVGPVKGVYSKENAMNKAREHALLVSSRPSFVTILTLVRDAAARLPNGEGTRSDICELLKDSQFLAPGVSDAQINVVVSGALDRLHSEKDPCVKYDVNRKLWIYLHRSRAEEEFERIHQAHAAAQKAKKSLAKPKTPKPPKTKEMPTPPVQQTTTTSTTASSSSPRVAQSLNSDALDDQLTPSSPALSNTNSPTPKGTPNSPVVGQVSPRGSSGSPRAATIASLTALNKAGANLSNLVTSANALSPQTGATIRFQLQQQQLAQLQQQQQQLQQSASLPGTPTKTGAVSPGRGSPTVTGTLLQTAPDTPTGVTKTLPFGLQSIRATLTGSNPLVTSTASQQLATAIRPEILLRQGSSGSNSNQSPAGTPTSATPGITKVLTSVNPVGVPTTVESAIVTTAIVSSTTHSAPLMARLVQQVAAGNQMVSVSNLLAAQRAQAQAHAQAQAQAQAQSPRASTTIKIQGSNVVHQVAGGKPVQLTGQAARGQLVQLAGKGQQQVGLLQQGALPTISIIPQGGTAGVMTLGQPRTPTANTDVVSSGSPSVLTGNTGTRSSGSATVTVTTPSSVGTQPTVQMVSQQKVVTPSQGGIVVTQLPHGSITFRPGTVPTSSQAKVVTAGQAGLLPTQFIVQQTTGPTVTNNATLTQSIADGAPLIVSGTGGKPGQNIQVVRTVLGQQAGLKPGQATILISQPTLSDSQATVVPHGQIIQNAKSNVKGTGKGKAQTGAVYARIIAPPQGVKLAPGQALPAQGVGMLQTVNKLLAPTSVAGGTASIVQGMGISMTQNARLSTTVAGDSVPKAIAQVSSEHLNTDSQKS